MAAVAADVATVRAALGAPSDVVIANINAPNQTVISGAQAAIGAAIDQLGTRGIHATRIPVSAAFHSPLMQPAQAPLVRFFDDIEWAPPRIPVYANTTAAQHDAEPLRIRALLERHLTESVDFVGMIEAMYAAGSRVFLEVGPKSVLTTLTRRILGKRPHCAVALDGAGGGVPGLLHALAAIMVQGVQADLARLFEGRDLPKVGLTHLGDPQEGPPGRTAGTWLLNGTRARRADAAIQTAVSVPAPAPAQPQTRATSGLDTREATVATQRRTRAVKESDMHGVYGPVRLDEDSAGEPTGIDRVIADHNQTMRQFLQMQERLMLAYLNGGGERMPRPFSTPRPATAPRPAMSQPAPAAPPSSRVPERPGPAPAAAPVATVTSAMQVASAPLPAVAPASTATNPKALLLKIASERTGYPEDMLGLDLNMEADLGIDSIKRVEILAAFRKAQTAAVSDYLQPRMSQISKSITLRDILDRVEAALLEMKDTKRPFDQAGTEQTAAALSRYVMRPEAEVLPPGQPTTVPPGIYLIVPDLTGIADALIHLLQHDGAMVQIVPNGLAAGDTATDAWLASVRRSGRIRGLINLASALPPETGRRGPDDWHDGMETSVKSMFALVRLAAPDLATGGIVAVVSAMGGEFGRDMPRHPGRAAAFPGAGGGVGLIKSLGMEWPGCTCKAIDLDPDETPAQKAAHLHAEIAAPAGRREVGYPGGTRTIFRTVPAPLDTTAIALDRPGPGWVVLAVGGARGITAETLRPFAKSGAVCVVVGRSALPEPEAIATVPFATTGTLRTHFLAEAAATGVRPTPAKIEARISAVLRDRETRANMADFAAMGAHIDYRICDVRQEPAVAAMLDAVYARYKRLDAVLFGAGLIEDRLIVDKTRESLSRVFDTKVDGAFFFARHLQPQTLKFLALFTSVAGRYGNRGQTDYAAANEVLNRFAWQLQAQFGEGTKVTAVNWGAWARTTNGPGMLTAETARQFRDRGLRLIEPDEGRDFLWDELLYASRDEVEVVAGEHPWDAQEDEIARAQTDADRKERTGT